MLFCRDTSFLHRDHVSEGCSTRYYEDSFIIVQSQRGITLGIRSRESLMEKFRVWFGVLSIGKLVGGMGKFCFCRASLILTTNVVGVNELI